VPGPTDVEVAWHTRPVRALVLVVAALCSLGPGCATTPARPTAPARALDPPAHSALMGEVDEIIAALAAGDVDRVATRMTPRLHEQLTVADLRIAARELSRQYGAPVGIMEERLQREGELLWYSGLVIHRAGRRGKEVSTPVLYQLALTPTRQLERLLVREHVFIEQLQAPAEGYVPVTRLHPPATGTWTVAQGGPTRELNSHHGSTSQRFAYDLVLVVDGTYRRPGADRRSNEAYYGYGHPLRAPAAGEVIRVIDGVPDNVPGQRGKAGGNGLVIDHGFGEFSSLWHARPGSLRVRVGDHVEAGQVVAEVGNSGRSTGSHIHLHLTRGDGELALPAPLVDVWVDGVPRELALPSKGERVQSRAKLEVPQAAGASGSEPR
jgi:murein DD-endopeptidase MepM/ murein hydrolase activator NlpD